MKAKIEIEMDNAAFEEMGHATELARILRDLAHEVEHNGETGCALHDINGNTVGKFEVLGSAQSEGFLSEILRNTKELNEGGAS